MYNLEARPHVEREFEKIKKKDKRRLDIISRKVDKILGNPYQFKPLKAPMQHLRRVHVDKSFVIIYTIEEPRKTVIIEDYDHHDNIYKHY